MTLIKRTILAFALIAGISPAIAQAPPPVPALPDTERRTTYVISGSTCACAVGFQLYGDSTDYTNWLEVFVNGALIPQSGNWAITSPTGSLATIPRPITDAVLTFATAQTGTVQIVGARRPRRTSQFSESRGVAARDLNQVLTDLTAQNRETWDKTNDVTGRAVLARPGETLALLPALASRMNTGACFDSGGNLTTCASIPSSTLIAGSGISLTGGGPVTIAANLSAGTGISITGTNPLVIASSLTASALTYTAPWTNSVAYAQSKYNANVVYMTDFMGTTTCDGVTDQFANMQAFLTEVAARGAANSGSVTGVFAPGVCYVTGSPTITTNSSSAAVNYRYVGYGTTILPNPASILTGLKVVRGTFLTHGDESRTITIEGLTIGTRNNANIAWGFDVADTRVHLVRNNCLAGDDGVTHAQGNFACFYWHQIDPTDPNTGPFYGKMFQNTCKGNGVGVSAVPICIRLDGSVNAMVISQNALAQGVYGMRVFNPCATVNANCAYMPNGLIFENNNVEGFSSCVAMQTSVPTLSALVGGSISGNTFESCSLSALDVATLTQSSIYPMTYGPNTFIGPIGTEISNPNVIQIVRTPSAAKQATINFTSAAANAQTTYGTQTINGADTTHACYISVSGNSTALIPKCYVSAANTVTVSMVNATAGAIVLGSQVARIHTVPPMN